MSTNRSLALLFVPCVLLGLALWWFALAGPDGTAVALAPAAPRPALDVGSPAQHPLAAAPHADRGAAEAPPDVATGAAAAAPQTPSPRAFPPLSPPPAAGVPISIVLQSDGTPVAGADVLVLDFQALGADVFDAYRGGSRLEDRAYEHGCRYQSGPDGIALVEPPLEQAYVMAFSGELYGESWFGGIQPGRVEVQLAPDRALDVDVVDELGQPLAGVEVLLDQVQSDESWSWTRTRAETDARGRARLEHAGFVLLEDGGDTRFRVALASAARERVSADLPRDAWPDAPLRLVAPAHGALEVALVGPDGDPLRDATPVYLRVLRPAAREATEAERERWDGFALSVRAEDGVARFGVVEPGLVCVVSCARHVGAKPREVEIAGPLAAGETARGEVRFADDVPRLAMLVVDAAGVALSGVLVDFTLVASSEGGTSTYTGRLQSDEAGRLELDVAPDWQPGGTRALTLRHVQPTRRSLQAKLDLSRLLPAGTNELGEVRLQGDEPLVAGTALDQLGQPLAGVQVSLQVRTYWGEGENFYWQPLWGIGDTSRQDGSFALYGAAEAEGVEVIGRRADYATARAEVALGDQSVVLRLGKSGSIAGSVVFPARVTRDDLWIQLEDENAAPKLGYDWYTRAVPRFRPDGRFEIADLEPGSYRLDLWANGPSEPLASFAGVRVAPGEVARDARLQAIDLGKLLRVIEIRLVVPPGADALPEGNCAYREAGSDDRENDSWAQWRQGRFRLLAQFSAVDVDLWCPPYKLERLLGLDRDVEVALVPGPRVKLVLSEPELIPPGLTLVANLIHDGGAIDNSWNTFSNGPVVEVALGAPGTWRVDWILSRESDQGSTAVSLDSGEQPTLIEVLDTADVQTFHLMPSREVIDLVLPELAPEDR